VHIACILSDGSRAADAVLAGVAAQALACGLRVVGVVQEETASSPGRTCHMDLRLLPDGPRLRISADRGALARGCRLDPDALERAVAETERRLAGGADLLILNRFGKHEAQGRGFRGAIAEAAGLGIPVLLAASPLNREALERFCGGEALHLPPDPAAAMAWFRRATGATAERGRLGDATPGPRAVA
jgi:hypothetical protein